MNIKDREIWSKSLNAAATYLIPPLTLMRYGKILLGIDKPDPMAGLRPENRDPDFVNFVYKKLKPLLKTYFRTKIEGTEHLPLNGPGLMVGNHNGGLQPFDSFMGSIAVIDKFGTDRPFFGLGHDYMFREPSFSDLLDKLGIIKASHEAAHKAFKLGGLVSVFPGGDIDTFKKFSDRHTIKFGGRTGFIRLAIKEGVPIYPVVSIGCHETWIVLSSGEKIARFLGLKKRIRTQVFPIVFSLPWGITSGFIPYIPFPSQITLRILPPIAFDNLTPEDADNPEIVQQCYKEVTENMQTALDEMAEKRNLPIFG
jgi:diacylglycerol/phytol O-acyltransferase